MEREIFVCVDFAMGTYTFAFLFVDKPHRGRGFGLVVEMVVMVKELLSPLGAIGVSILRCIGLNYLFRSLMLKYH